MSERKVLYSPRHGAGWVSWCGDPAVKRLMIDWPPLVAAVEAKESITKTHPAVLSLLEEVDRVAGKEKRPYLGGLRDIAVATGTGRVRVMEYDGFESLEWENEDHGEWV